MGKGSSGGGGSSQTQNYSSPWGPIQPGLEQEIQNLLGVTMPGGSLAPYTFPNQQVAGLNPTELEGLSGIAGTGEAQQGNVGEGIGLTGQILAGDQLNPATNPYLQGTSQAENAQTIAQYQNAIAPSNESNAALSGAFGGSADASNRALSQFDLGNTLSNTNELLYGQNFEQAQNNQLSTLENLGQIESGQQAPNEAILGAGGVQQQQQQQELSTAYQNQLSQAQWPYQLLSYITSQLQGIGAGYGKSYSQTNESGGGSSGLQDTLGLGSLGLGAASLFGSSAGGTSAASGLGSSLEALGPALLALL